METLGTRTADPIEMGYKPFMVYPWETSEKIHISSPAASYAAFGKLCFERTRIEKWIADPPFDLDHLKIEPGILPRKF
jgi:hypothetical protein